MVPRLTFTGVNALFRGCPEVYAPLSALLRPNAKQHRLAALWRPRRDNAFPRQTASRKSTRAETILTLDGGRKSGEQQNQGMRLGYGKSCFFQEAF
jgi:hypothetical protein